jgi:mannose-6-phosphate isomerase-like protein (cupin superfamily)
MAHFTLPPEAVSKAVAHRTIEEVWYFVSGHGLMWRRLGDHEETVEVRPGTSITIPVGTQFQFCSDRHEPLVAVGATLPPWPGEEEAYDVAGPWTATV